MNHTTSTVEKANAYQGTKVGYAAVCTCGWATVWFPYPGNAKAAGEKHERAAK